ncbi:hypothetical protein BASA61_010276 [Batrachochytrium salamandrivorans]|nr:hypothetical protein BASA61_010276 [Batrachochytrium salamandrivorans]
MALLTILRMEVVSRVASQVAFPGGFPGGFAGGFGSAESSSGGFGADFFDQVFQKFSGAGGARHGEDVFTSTKITFMEAVAGTEKPLSFVSARSCKPCTGSGVKPGHKKSTCTTCRGSGKIVIPNGNFHMVANCPNCDATGTSIPHASKCTSCNGAGLIRERQSISVKIPAGVEDGMKIRLSGQGDATSPGQGPHGDLIVSINVSSHPIFKRDGPDILMKTTIPLHIAILGGTIRIPTIEGDVDLTIPSGTQPNERKVLRSRGAPDLSLKSSYGSSRRGDQWVTLVVEVPKSLTVEQKRLMMEAFGDKKAQSTFEDDSSFSKSNLNSHTNTSRSKSTDDPSSSNKSEGSDKSKKGSYARVKN